MSSFFSSLPVRTRGISDGLLPPASERPTQSDHGAAGDGRQEEDPERRAVHLSTHGEHDRTGHLAEGGEPRSERRHCHQGHPDGEQRVEKVAKLQHAQSHDAHAVDVLASLAGVVERGEEHDRGVGQRLGEVLATYRHIDGADEREIAECQGEQLEQYAASAEHVGVVGAIEAAVTTGAVARREHEATTHVVHALAAPVALTLDARRRRHDALHPGGAARQAVALVARLVTQKAITTAGAGGLAAAA